jgi:hypothetical protein
VPGETVREDAGEIVEEGVGHSLKTHEVALVLLGDARGKGTESLVLPQDVVAAFGAVSDPEAALPGQAHEPAVAKERAQDHLELDGVRRDPMKRGAGMLDHTDDFDRGLRSPRPAYLEKRRRFAISESVGSNRFTRCLNGKSDGETVSFATARTGWGEIHSFGIHVGPNGCLGRT